QHIPVVSALFQDSTKGVAPSTGAKLAGGLLFGGPIGFVFALMDTVMEQKTGKDASRHLLAMVDQKPKNSELKANAWQDPDGAAHGISAGEVEVGMPELVTAQPRNKNREFKVEIETLNQKKDGAVVAIQDTVKNQSTPRLSLKAEKILPPVLPDPREEKEPGRISDPGFIDLSRIDEFEKKSQAVAASAQPNEKKNLEIYKMIQSFIVPEAQASEDRYF
ncbi:MAG: hypothetical protein Q8O19_02840, partial [Rectinemataceae bacterium]|nr:hypothetical protein [Rectinemataceae bacterium]